MLLLVEVMKEKHVFVLAYQYLQMVYNQPHTWHKRKSQHVFSVYTLLILLVKIGKNKNDICSQISDSFPQEGGTTPHKAQAGLEKCITVEKLHIKLLDLLDFSH